MFVDNSETGFYRQENCRVKESDQEGRPVNNGLFLTKLMNQPSLNRDGGPFRNHMQLKMIKI